MSIQTGCLLNDATHGKLTVETVMTLLLMDMVVGVGQYVVRVLTTEVT